MYAISVGKRPCRIHSDRKWQDLEKNRDRELKNTIQAVDISLRVGFAGILASSYQSIEKPWPFPSPQHHLLPPHPFFIAIAVRCLCGGGWGWFA
ncbi:MAG: hypothetical protein ICV61_09330 [Microcoleus sp. Co-bin12]|nr:hypothetical protein [Microcoleus sp. Co-bin12]